MSALPLNGQKRLSAVLLLAAAALVALLAYEWQQGIALRDSVLALKTRPAATPPALHIEPPFRLNDLAAYARITEQPLFVASREPAKAEPVQAAKPPEQFQLTGVAQSPQQDVVLLRNVKTGKTERLKTGEKTPDGLQLETVKPNGVTLKQNGQDVTLDLSVALSAPPTAPPTAPAPSTSPVVPPSQAGGASVPKPKAPPAVIPNLDQINKLRAKMGLVPLAQ